MPMPLLHSAVGIAAVRFASRGNASRRALAIAAAIAILPDFDLLPGLLLGDPIRFHHGVTHSILWAVVVAWAASRLLWDEREEIWRARRFWTLLAVALSHPGLDLFNYEEPVVTHLAAQRLFWPLHTAVWPVAQLFSSAPIPADPRLWLSSAFFSVLGREIVLSSGLLLLAWRLPGRERAAAPAGLGAGSLVGKGN